MGSPLAHFPGRAERVVVGQVASLKPGAGCPRAGFIEAMARAA
jgi:hypothetical protein